MGSSGVPHGDVLIRASLGWYILCNCLRQPGSGGCYIPRCGKKSVKLIPNKYRRRNSGRMGLSSLETSKIQPLLWGRQGPSVLNVPIFPIQENSSSSRPPALPQTAATLHLQHQCVWGHHDHLVLGDPP